MRATGPGLIPAAPWSSAKPGVAPRTVSRGQQRQTHFVHPSSRWHEPRESGSYFSVPSPQLPLPTLRLLLELHWEETSGAFKADCFLSPILDRVEPSPKSVQRKGITVLRGRCPEMLLRAWGTRRAVKNTGIQPWALRAFTAPSRGAGSRPGTSLLRGSFLVLFWGHPRLHSVVTPARLGEPYGLPGIKLGSTRVDCLQPTPSGCARAPALGHSSGTSTSFPVLREISNDSG